MDAGTAIGFVGGAYGLTIGATLFSLRQSSPLPNRLFALLLTLLGAVIAAITIDHAYPAAPAGIEVLEVAISLAVGPLLLAFVAVSRFPRFTFGRTHLIHFLPALAFLITAIGSGSEDFPSQLIVVFQAPYTAMAVLLCRTKSRSEGIDWAAILAWSFVFIHIAQLLRTFGGEFFRDTIPVAGTLLLLYTSSIAWRRAFGPPGRTTTKYARSALTSTSANEVLQRFETMLVEERPWRDPKYSLSTAARALNVTPQLLSQAINQHGESTFADRVTRHRLESVRDELIRRPAADVKIEALALNAGFASRSSFYDAFRRAYGTTPTRYRDEHQAGTTSGTTVPDKNG